ncbi:MAG: hypothetical protein J5685_09270, partial [Clostridiales bacterium]|nr:hypothetical protein [Clostridiales bacterium]
MFSITNRVKKGAAVLLSASLVVGNFSVNGALFRKQTDNVYAASLPAMQDSASAVNFSTILNGATDYGIVAQDLYQRGHMETTFATEVFHNSNHGDSLVFNNDVDFLPSGTTAQFIIGSLGVPVNHQTGVPYDGETSVVNLGLTRCSTYVIDGTSAVFTGFPDTSPSRAGSYGNFYLNSDFFAHGTPSIVANENENATSNVTRLLTSTAGGYWSDFINDRANDADYRLNVSQNNEFVTYTGANSATLNLTDPAFENRVVYIEVTSDLLNAIQSTGGLTINKLSSTIVAFNINSGDSGVVNAGDTLQLAKFTVNVVDKDKTVTSVTSSNGNSSVTEDGHHYTSNDVDSEICQKIIWNLRVPDTVNIELNCTAGTIIAPEGHANVIGSSSGWLIADEVHVTSGEFHYLYQGGSDDQQGQMHFSLDKKFTHEFVEAGATGADQVVPDTSIEISAGQYTFFFDEYTDATFTTPAASHYHDEASNSELADVSFKKLVFNDSSDPSHYVARPASGEPDTERTFYFRITEDQTSSVSGITNSNCHIDITMKVVCDPEGNYTYFVDAVSYYTDTQNVERIYKEEHNIRMSGVQYDIGAYYNLVDASLIIDKDVTGCEAAENKTFSFTVYDETDGHYVLQDGSTCTADDRITGTVSQNIVITGLVSGHTYTVHEDTGLAGIDGYTLNVIGQ